MSNSRTFLQNFRHFQQVYQKNGGLCNYPYCFVAKLVIKPFPPLISSALIIYVWLDTCMTSYKLLWAESAEVRFWADMLWFWGHFFLILGVWSYIRAMFQSENSWQQEELEEILNENDRNPVIPKHKLPTHCGRCDLLRPARAHHCSWCGRCIDKMDHHCPWVGGCVGRHNYKYFYLFMLHTVIAELVIFLFLVGAYHNGVMSWRRVANLLSVTGALILSEGFLLLFHTLLLFTNLSTIDCVICFVFRRHKKNKNPHYVDILTNIQEVLGTTPWKMFLPLKVSPDHTRHQPQWNV